MTIAPPPVGRLLTCVRGQVELCFEALVAADQRAVAAVRVQPERRRLRRAVPAVARHQRLVERQPVRGARPVVGEQPPHPAHATSTVW
jgi:hypothetical protein